MPKAKADHTPRGPRAKPYGLAQRDQLDAEPAFTTEGLRDVLDAACGPRLVVPGEVEIAVLAGILNWWRAWFLAAEEARQRNAEMARAEAAIVTLREVLPGIVAHHRARADAGDPFAAWQARDGGRVATAIASAGVGFLQRDELSDHARDWRWLAEVLLVDFEAALRPANPKYRPGAAKGGPFARFLAAVIPRISGEHTSAKAVGTQIGNIRKANLS